MDCQVRERERTFKSGGFIYGKIEVAHSLGIIRKVAKDLRSCKGVAVKRTKLHIWSYGCRRKKFLDSTGLEGKQRLNS